MALRRQATRHYLNQRRLDYWRIYASPGLDEIILCDGAIYILVKEMSLYVMTTQVVRGDERILGWVRQCKANDVILKLSSHSPVKWEFSACNYTYFIYAMVKCGDSVDEINISTKLTTSCWWMYAPANLSSFAQWMSFYLFRQGHYWNQRWPITNGLFYIFMMSITKCQIFSLYWDEGNVNGTYAFLIYDVYSLGHWYIHWYPVAFLSLTCIQFGELLFISKTDRAASKHCKCSYLIQQYRQRSQITDIQDHGEGANYEIEQTMMYVPWCTWRWEFIEYFGCDQSVFPSTRRLFVC